MDQFFTVLTQIGIFLILIALGVLAVKVHILDEHSLGSISKVIMRMALPAYIFINTAEGATRAGLASSLMVIPLAIALYLLLFLLSLALAGVRMAAEWFHLWLFARFHYVPSGKAAYTIGMIVVCLALAYGPLPFGAPPDLAQYLLYPATVTLLVAVGCLCARVIARYPHHYELILATCQSEKIPGKAAAASGRFLKALLLRYLREKQRICN